MDMRRLEYLRNQATFLKASGFSAGEDLAEAVNIIDELRAALLPLSLTCGNDGPRPEEADDDEDETMVRIDEVRYARRALGLNVR
jgi:hypothetical protein